ncbi:HAMP domain-containing histidine kinase [Flavobacteriaceae bacterium AH-315-B10]|nr:HAMP domain-containing histidine kinase [Flavobacteriaceae bacterium AH-315-B10]
MNDKRYQWILYVIVFVILGTISIQVYWNYKNYLVNKQQLISDVQQSLDNAVETYFADLAENNTMAFAFGNKDAVFFRERKLNGLIQKIQIDNRNLKSCDTIDIELLDSLTVFNDKMPDSFLISINRSPQTSMRPVFRDLHRDSTSQGHFRKLTTKVILSLTTDTLSLKNIDSLFKKELSRKNLAINYGFTYNNVEDKMLFFNPDIVKSSALKTSTKSPFLGNKGILTVHFSNETKIILKRILTGILISTLLVLVVISCLFYLLKIIKHQKQLAEVKNDLISNITHEFKTPIATISVALESIKNFNVIDDKEKTKTYLDMSNNQLSKLNIMVEKLLETASLDSDSLDLNKEPVNITDLLKTIINKHKIQTNGKTINFNSSKEIIANVDVFHIENAINNIIDNAVKYGGEIISIQLKKHNNQILISISDNGNTLNKDNKDKIFEKFYRVSKGNTHDVKGFGIGLYYAKKIIEKHNGSIHLDLNNELTTFKISFPNE